MDTLIEGTRRLPTASSDGNFDQSTSNVRQSDTSPIAPNSHYGSRLNSVLTHVLFQFSTHGLKKPFLQFVARYRGRVARRVTLV